jgi:hypothetical protein
VDSATGKNKYAHIVGNGTSRAERSNAHTLDWDGNAWYQGDVYVGSTSGKNKDEGSKKLATEEYVSTLVGDTNVATQISNAVAQKSQVQIVEQNVSEFLPTLTIHKLTQDEYNQKLDAGALDANALYLTPDEEIDVAGQINEAIKNKSDIGHTHTAAEVGADANGSAASALISAKSYTDTKISELINSAPSTLDTLGEIATAMSENTDVVAALDNAIGTKANSSDLNAHINNTSNPHKVTLSQLGVTATPAELNYVSGVDSNVQEQLSRMSSLIGDVAVSAQINSAVAQKSQVQIITWEADD